MSDLNINNMQICMQQADSVWNVKPATVVEPSAHYNPFQRTGNVAAGRGSLIIKCAALFLLIAVVSLSTLAKASRCLPQSNPARYLSQASKMRETPTQKLNDCRPLRRDRANWLQPTAESGVPFYFETESPLPKSSATLNAHQLRSPPSNLS